MADGGGLRLNAGKLPLELIPPEVEEALAKVLRYGAEKYTLRFDSPWQSLFAVPGVTDALFIIRGDYAARATRDSSGKTILTLQKGKEGIAALGHPETETVFGATEDYIAVGSPSVAEAGSGPVDEPWKFSGSRCVSFVNSPPVVVGSVAGVKTCALITTIEREGSAVFCVVHATSPWACLEMTLRALKQRGYTLKEHGLKTFSGRNNWLRGMDHSICYACARRHLLKWWRGEDKDEESGLSHLWHALTNIAFLVTYEERKIGEDDRPVAPPATAPPATAPPAAAQVWEFVKERYVADGIRIAKQGDVYITDFGLPVRACGDHNPKNGPHLILRRLP